MRILLTHGYFVFEDEAERRVMKPYPPLGILYLAAYLRNEGIVPDVFDSTFGSKETFRDFVIRHKPALVGFSVNLMTKVNVIELMQFCRAQGCRIIVGGPDVPEYVDNYLASGADVVVFGEGEQTLAELVLALEANTSLDNIAGIAFRRPDGTVVKNPPRALIQDLDSLPLPARDLIDMNAYVDAWRSFHGKGSVSIICARGCPFTCTWCSRSVFGDSHRRRSPARVVDEIEMLMKDYKPDQIWFADDVFTINHPWFNQFHAEMQRRGIRIPFECISRADRLNDEILRKMAEIGSYRIWFGSESGSQKILDAMQRRVTTEKIVEVTRQAQKYGIEAGLFVMLGYPGEQLSDIRETVNHLKAANPDIFLTTVAYPIKGTSFHESTLEQLRVPLDWNNTTDRNIRITGRFSDKFYWYANRYVVNEVKSFKLRSAPRPDYFRAISAFVKAKAAMVGMQLTRSKRS